MRGLRTISVFGLRTAGHGDSRIPMFCGTATASSTKAGRPYKGAPVRCNRGLIHTASNGIFANRRGSFQFAAPRSQPSKQVAKRKDCTTLCTCLRAGARSYRTKILHVVFMHYGRFERKKLPNRRFQVPKVHAMTGMECIDRMQGVCNRRAKRNVGGRELPAYEVSDTVAIVWNSLVPTYTCLDPIIYTCKVLAAHVRPCNCRYTF